MVSSFHFGYTTKTNCLGLAIENFVHFMVDYQWNFFSENFILEKDVIMQSYLFQLHATVETKLTSCNSALFEYYL